MKDRGVSTPRRAGRASVVFFIMCALAVLLAGKVQAMELSGMQAASPVAFSTQLPQPRDYGDNCARYLNEYNDNHAMDVASERDPGTQEQGVSLVIGLRVAFGSGEAHSSSHVSFNMWQPAENHDPAALAVADYRSCESSRALGLGDGE